MGLYSASFLKGTNFFCKFSPVTSRDHQLPENSSSKSSHQSISFIKIRSWRHHASRRGEFLPVCGARLRRPSRRRNSLREKLIGSGEAQVRELSEIPILDSNSHGSDHAVVGTKSMGLSSDFDDTSERVESIGISSKNVEFSGSDSALWDRLEYWVELYKKDSEFWGIGSGPIFTVYQDSEGNVLRVSVSEDEISRRDQSKIAHAKFIAKEIESGACLLPKNSSIAKFIVEGKQTSLIDGVLSIPLQVNPLLKLFPRVGLTVLCCSSVLWVVTNFFVKKIDKMERSSEEIEMLRRKKKARMEEEVKKINVEVLQDVQKLPVGSFDKRPQLDRGELMQNIMQAKKLRENFTLSASSSDFGVQDPEFDRKVREIREMAKQAREEERREHAQFDEKGDGDGISVRSGVSKGPNGSRSASAEIKSREEAHKGPPTSNCSLVDSEKNKSISAPLDRKEVLVEDNLISTENVSATSEIAKSSKEITDNINAEKTALAVNMTLSEDVFRNKEIEQQMESLILSDREINSTSTDAFSRVPGRNKPKFISSIREAKEYLARKRTSAVDNMQADQVTQVKRQPGVIEAENGTYADTPNEENIQNHSFSAKVVDFSHVNEPPDVGFVKRAIEVSDNSCANAVSEMRHIDNVTKPDLNKGSIGFTKLFDSVDGFRMTEEKYLNNHDQIQDDKSGEILSFNGGLQKGDAGKHNTLTDSIDLRFEKLNNEHKVTNKIATNCSNYTSDSTHTSESCKISLDESCLNVGLPSVVSYNNDGEFPSQEFNNAKDNNNSMPGSNFEKHKHDIGVSDISTNDTVSTDGSCVSDALKVSMKNKTAELYDGQIVSGVKLDDLSVGNPCSGNGSFDDSKVARDLGDLSRSETSFIQDPVVVNCDTEAKPAIDEKTWLETNFHEFDHIVKKIGVGFRENYMMAREKTQDMSSLSAEISELGLTEGDEELEWMNNEKLREIVFRVRENELSGRDPFHLLDADDKQAFFEGLECKAEKVNKKLLGLHEWIHSRVENLDYGADGISLDDPPEKIVPRWKGPSFDKTPEFLNNSALQRKAFLAGKVGASEALEDTSTSSPQQQKTLNSSDSPLSPVNGENRKAQTLIESSDGSSRVGRKGGKEHWEHTKKWSQDFLNVYNSQTDPEIKSIMRDMGKDLDRWLTEKDRQDVADLVTRLSNRRRKFIEKKMDKLKREMQMFGPQAVVSKYREYSDEKEEDYLWWLDLRSVLCIELYTAEDGNPRVGFYSLEMAADLVLDPKQYHVIAFEDPGDAKNFCYIIQAHMDMLGSGKAFVIARPPKDAFRDAKADGFNVTVIRKGEIKLNVDQTLEEVEEEITEIGSKIYHDKIMHERGVDIRSLLRGVINAEKSTKRSKRVLKKPTKN
ncbi:hypothetical protein DsansV1_C20g0164871 [Dioscorea sansibarensis]